MEKCIVFCAAAFDALLSRPQPGDYILAADGGVRHTQALGLKTDAVIGDFDSLGYVPAESVVYPVEKDDTDAMLAARHGLGLGFREFLFYGSLDGPRLDHTVANFQTLQFLADRGAFGYLVGRKQLVTVVKNGSLRFPAGAEGILSVFCMGADSAGVTLKNLHYPLENSSLSSGFPLGVSNHFTGEGAVVSVRNGSLLVLWDRKNGLPERGEAL